MAESSAIADNVELAQVREEEADQPEELDIMEQLRRESIDLQVNPIGMRKVLFKLQTDFSSARKK